MAVIDRTDLRLVKHQRIRQEDKAAASGFFPNNATFWLFCMQAFDLVCARSDLCVVGAVVKRKKMDWCETESWGNVSVRMKKEAKEVLFNSDPYAMS